MTRRPLPPLLLLLPLLLAIALTVLPKADATSSTSLLRRTQQQTPSLTLGASTDRPARVVLPSSYHSPSAKKRQYPVLMVLHGWGSSGNYHDFYLGISERADKHNFITIMPNGTMDPKRGGRFWDARACCNHDRLPVDDEAYLSGLVQEATQKYRIDSANVYAVGHSNGGLMSQILACQHSELFSGFAAVAPGPIPAMCWETKAKKVLMIGGTEDKWTPPCFIQDNAKRYAEYLKCPYENPTIQGEMRNYDCDDGPHPPHHPDSLYDPYRDKNCEKTGPAAETAVTEWHGCGASQDRKLGVWAVGEATHNPSFNAEWSDDVIAWLLT